MDKKIIKFGDTKIQNTSFNTTVVSNKVSFDKKGFKYYIGYKDGKKSETFVYIASKNECNKKRF